MSPFGVMALLAFPDMMHEAENPNWSLTCSSSEGSLAVRPEIIKRLGVFQARGLKELGETRVLALFKAPDQLLRNLPDEAFYKRSEGRIVVKTCWPATSVCSVPTPIFVKQIESPFWRHWGCVLTGIYTRSRRNWEFGFQILQAGVSTPRPLLFVEQPKPGALFAPVEETIVTREATGLIPLELFLTHTLPGISAEKQKNWRRRYYRLIGQELAKLHHARFDHRDLKAMNIMVAEDLDETSYSILDLDAARRWLWLPRMIRNKNLGRITSSLIEFQAYSSSDALRGLLAFRQTAARLTGRPSSRNDKRWKSQWQGIARFVALYQARRKKKLQKTLKLTSTSTPHRKAA